MPSGRKSLDTSFLIWCSEQDKGLRIGNEESVPVPAQTYNLGLARHFISHSFPLLLPGHEDQVMSNTWKGLANDEDLKE